MTPEQEARIREGHRFTSADLHAFVAALDAEREQVRVLTKERDAAQEDLARLTNAGRCYEGHVAVVMEERDRLREALSWALDMLDMYDEFLAGIDGPTTVYTDVHVAGKTKARAALLHSRGEGEGGGRG